MRIFPIACAAMSVAACSGELAERSAVNDPTSVAAAEAPYRRLPQYEPDPLLSPVPPKSAESSPTGTEPAHSPTATPPGNPPIRGEPGAHTPAAPPKPPPDHHDHGSKPPPSGTQHEHHGAAPQPTPKTVYTCPMHPEVRSAEPGKCPKCGMTLVPVEPGQSK
jgi:hypothetical protein